jgi:hypothetical protein
VTRHQLDPEEVERFRVIARAEARAAPRLTAEKRAELAPLLDTADLGPARYRPSPSRRESAQVSPLPGDGQPDRPGVKSETVSEHGRDSGRAHDDR